MSIGLDFMIAICVLSTSISMIFPSFIAIFNLRYLFSASDLSQARTCEALLVPIRQLDFHSDSHLSSLFLCVEGVRSVCE